MNFLFFKVFHIVLVISWFSGLFYLPRIFVYLSQSSNDDVKSTLLKMARNLYRFTNIISVPALGSGFWMFFVYGIGQKQGWMHLKLSIVLMTVIYNHICGSFLKNFQKNRNIHSHIFYRWFNEIPLFLLVLIVNFVVVQPFSFK